MNTNIQYCYRPTTLYNNGNITCGITHITDANIIYG